MVRDGQATVKRVGWVRSPEREDRSSPGPSDIRLGCYSHMYHSLLPARLISYINCSRMP